MNTTHLKTVTIKTIAVGYEYYLHLYNHLLSVNRFHVHPQNNYRSSKDETDRLEDLL